MFFYKKSIFSLMVSAAICAATVANPAIRTGWAMDSMGCIITEESAQKNIAFQVAGKTTFRDGAVGTFTLICPISSGPLIPETRHGEDFVVKQLEMTWQDGDAEGPAGAVTVQLRHVNKKTGHVETIIGFDSNSLGVPNSGPSQFATHGVPDLTQGVPNHGINHRLNFQTHYYYIQVTVKRTNARVPVKFMGASLWFG